MIDIDKCMDWWKDNRGNYRDNMGNRDGTDAEEELINTLYAEVKRLRERNDRLCEDLKRTRRWIQKQVQPLKTIAWQADYVACTAEKEILDEYIGDD